MMVMCSQHEGDFTRQLTSGHQASVAGISPLRNPLAQSTQLLVHCPLRRTLTAQAPGKMTQPKDFANRAETPLQRSRCIAFARLRARPHAHSNDTSTPAFALVTYPSGLNRGRETPSAKTAFARPLLSRQDSRYELLFCMIKRNVSTPPPLHCSATEPFTKSGMRRVPTKQDQHQQARARP